VDAAAGARWLRCGGVFGGAGGGADASAAAKTRGPVNDKKMPAEALETAKREATIVFLEWLLPLLVQVLVAGPLHRPPLLTSQNMTSTAKSWVDQ